MGNPDPLVVYGLVLFCLYEYHSGYSFERRPASQASRSSCENECTKIGGLMRTAIAHRARPAHDYACWGEGRAAWAFMRPWPNTSSLPVVPRSLAVDSIRLRT